METLPEEFNSWPMTDDQIVVAEQVRWAFAHVLETCQEAIPQHNARYLAIVKTHLEEACMMAVKGVVKPLT